MCFKEEEKLINYYKSIGQCQCNYVFGGCGGVRTYWTKEMKEKMSINNPMKSKEQRQRMSTNNPMKNPEIAKKVVQKHSKTFYIGNNKFNNLKEASKYYKKSPTGIAYWLKCGKNPNGDKCYQIKKDKKPIVVNREEVFIIFRNKKYKTIREISEKENIPYKTLENWLKRGFSSKGEYIRYSNDKKEYVYIKPNKTHTNKVIKINGKIYNSILDASKELSICCTTLRKYLNNKKTNKCKYNNLICEYVNQQPSHTNSDKSSMEGSTTNE